MEKNAHINARLIDLANALDARATVSIYELDKNGTQVRIGDCAMPVYELLTAMNDNTNAFYKVRRYDVIGLVFDLTNRILIKKGE